MPRHLISDAHEWINEIPAVPIYRPAKPQPRERSWRDRRGKKTLLSLTLVRRAGRLGGRSISGRLRSILKYHYPRRRLAHSVARGRGRPPGRPSVPERRPRHARREGGDSLPTSARGARAEDRVGRGVRLGRHIRHKATRVSQDELDEDGNLASNGRVKARSIPTSSTGTNRESAAYRSFRPSGFEARGVRKVTTGITGLWQPSVRSDVAF